MIYTIEVLTDEFPTLVPVDESVAASQFGSLRAKAKRMNWPAPLNVAVEESDVMTGIADVSLIQIGSMILNQHAYECLAELIKEWVDFYPIQIDGMEYYFVNVVKVADALDKERTEYNSFGGVKKPVFVESKVSDLPIFKIAEDNYTGIYCNEIFRQRVDQCQLTGFELIKEECV